MEDQEQRVLDAYYKNAAVGMDAIQSIFSKTEHPDLRWELSKQMEYYTQQKAALAKQMETHCRKPQESGELAKLCTNLSIHMHCVGGATAGEIAKLMVKGTNEGIIQLTEVLHRNTEIPDKLKHQGNAILRHEEAYLNRLKAYL